MNTKRFLFTTLFAALSAAPQGLCSEALFTGVADSATANPKEDALYADGTRAINDGRWAEAETVFTNIAQQRGARAEAALYWKAYAENKQGNSTRALDTCKQLSTAYLCAHW